MVYKFFDKESVGSSVTTLANKSTIKNENMLNQELAKTYTNQLLENFKSEK